VKKQEMISVFGSDLGDEEIDAVAECMRSQWPGFGSMVERFEESFASRLKLPSFAMVDSGSNALFLAMRLLDLPPGAEVIIPSFTWVSCAQAALMANLRPVFCDVDISTMNVRREHVEACLTPRTGAVMVVHYAGLPVDIDPILDLGLPVVEDAAHAVDALSQGRCCGGIGDVGIYSFDAVKNLTTGEGGGIALRDASSIGRARQLRYCGIGKSGFDAATSFQSQPQRWWEYDIQEPFIKMLPTNIAAAIGLVQLRRLDALQARRRSIWETYQRELADVPEVILPPEAPPCDQHGYFTFCVRVPQRDELAKTLLASDIYTTLRYHPLHLNRLYGQTDCRLKNCEKLNEEALSIPLHPRLSDADVERVIHEVRKFYRRSGG
jgi:dTDP-4-amino-4,6-dideoxygalactose transaminase